MGKKHKRHQAHNSSSVSAELDPARQTYAEEWSVSASSFAEKGHYDWMASFLPKKGVVLEVGVGAGHSTEAISRIARSVVGVDENPICVQAANSHLLRAGVRCEAVSRQSLNPARDGHYDLGHKKIEVAPLDPGVLLLEGDLAPDPSSPNRCVDRNLESWLRSLGRIDAVACWLVGTHSHRHANLAVAKRGVSSSGNYRLFVQNFVYELADQLLRPGGILHIVDRGFDLASDAALRADVLAGHISQASVTTLEVDTKLKQRQYDEVTGGTAMVWTPPALGSTRTAKPPQPQDQHFFTSIIARKPSAPESLPER